jgi:DNA repair protein RadD
VAVSVRTNKESSSMQTTFEMRVKEKPKFIPRDYQAKGIEIGVRFMNSDKGHNAIQVLPTGSGKSILIANICKEITQPVLVLQPSKEILKQNYAKYVSYGNSAGIFSASLGRKDLGHVTFASIQSVMSRNGKGEYYSAHLFKHFQHIICDEVHLGSSAKGSQLLDFLEMVKEHSGKIPRVLGFSATPFRLYPCTDRHGNKDSMLKMLTRTRPRIFGEINYSVQISDLLEQGFLAKCRYFDVRSQLKHGFDRTKLKVNSTGADYVEADLQKYYDTIHFKEDIVDLVNRITATGRQVLVFMSSVSDALWVSERLLDSATVHGKTPDKERDKTEEWFKKGLLRSVCNCGVWQVGFDYEALKTVLIARPVRSLSWYYQAFGRAMRPFENQDAFLIDACGNFGVFGKIEDLKISTDSKGLPVILGTNGKLLTGVPLKEQESFVTDNKF